MADAKPDEFARPFLDFQSHARATPRSMGGAAPVVPPGPHGQGRPLDPALEAAKRRRDNKMTRVYDFAAAGIMPVTGPLVLDVDGPASGFVWDIKSIQVGPEDYSQLPYATGVTVIAFLRGQGLTTTGSNGQSTTATDVISYTQAWPAQGFWGRHQATCQFPSRLQIMVLGFTAGAWVTVGGQAEQTAVDVAETFAL